MTGVETGAKVDGTSDDNFSGCRTKARSCFPENERAALWETHRQRVCVWMYLRWRGGLQSVKAKRSAEGSLVKVGQVTCLEEIKLAV